jgi:small subunit ribosomal protein S11
MEEKAKTATAVAESPKTSAKGAKAPAKRRSSGKKKPVVSSARAYIQATYNNTIVTLTDQSGNTLAWSSAGSSGFTGPKKSTPYAASIVVKNALEKAADYGIKEVNVFICGVGQGREGAIRAFHANAVNVLGIKDVTPIPHNGCRPPRPRRV